jgi:hypothetical protein
MPGAPGELSPGHRTSPAFDGLHELPRFRAASARHGL